MCSIAPPYQNLLGRLVELTSQQHLEGCFEVRIGPISVSECPWEHHRAVRPMVRGVSALSKHIHWPWKANRRVYHSRAGLWSSIFACLIARGVHGLFWSWGNPGRSNARYNYSPEGTASRSRHFTSLGGQLECKDDQGTRNLRPQVKIRARAFDFCLSTSIPVLTTSTYVVIIAGYHAFSH